MPSMKAPHPLDDLIAEAERELAMRMDVFPRRVAAGKMSSRLAEDRIDMQREIVALLRTIHRPPNDPRAARALQQELFATPPPTHGDPKA